jgi:hypothetical protein
MAFMGARYLRMSTVSSTLIGLEAFRSCYSCRPFCEYLRRDTARLVTKARRSDAPDEIDSV